MATINIIGNALSGTTGTGNFVGATSPTLVTPTLGVATATSINKMAITAPATSSTLAVADGKTFTCSNTLTFTGTDTSSVAFGAGGTVIYSGGSPTFAAITFSPTTGGIVGTTTNDNAAAGKVGEYVTSNIAYASAVSLSNTTAKTMTSISLTAGDWDVGGNVIFNVGGTCTGCTAAISGTNNTLPTDASGWAQIQGAAVLSPGFAVPTVRQSLSGTTTIYIIGYAAFSTSTVGVAGNIWARRVR